MKKGGIDIGQYQTVSAIVVPINDDNNTFF